LIGGERSLVPSKRRGYRNSLKRENPDAKRLLWTIPWTAGQRKNFEGKESSLSRQAHQRAKLAVNGTSGGEGKYVAITPIKQVLGLPKRRRRA